MSNGLMRYVLVGGGLLWLASTFYLLLTWDFSPDSFLSWATLVICLGGIVLGLLGAIVLIVSGLWSGHREKQQWS
jgi:hypothetical protein